MKKTNVKEVKAWIFLDSNGGTITGPWDDTEIYLKKPPARRNPFDYSANRKKTWKPTEITITFTLPTK